jgi:hypothetical protein
MFGLLDYRGLPHCGLRRPRGTSNQDALTVASKWGKTMKVKAQISHHADEMTSKVANALGIYLDLHHR